MEIDSPCIKSVKTVFWLKIAIVIVLLIVSQMVCIRFAASEDNSLTGLQTPGDTIIYQESMACGGNQELSTKNGGSYKWEVTGEGQFNDPSSGDDPQQVVESATGVILYSTASNSDCSADIKVAIYTKDNEDNDTMVDEASITAICYSSHREAAYCILVCIKKIFPYRGHLRCSTKMVRYCYNCFDEPIGHVISCYAGAGEVIGTDCNPCPEPKEGCGPYDVIVDVRTEYMKEHGCCPAGLKGNQ